MSDPETSVEVAVRIRPQNAREQIDMCRVCTSCSPGQPQIVLGKDKAFTYDFVFDTDSQQEHIYSTSIEPLVEGCFEGYNATVLAYGQTGSGKTYTMGTGFDVELLPEMQGMIPRAVEQIFAGIEERRTAAMERNEPPPQFEIIAQFLELYNEELIDLFESRDAGKRLRIHEDVAGGICIAGVISLKVESQDETLACLQRGALSRTVGSTNMNAQSSRSHAIFTLHIQQQRPIKSCSSTEGESPPSQPEGQGDWETLRAKFHFVDLAGSERLKRTGATGDRAKEGISINCGLLALGNVISALGDVSKKASHVPYRDSKLTRLLQDSLGGNSRTLMIACISPTDRDFMETLNTLKYSNRARNIKNKVMVNQDKGSAQLAALRSRIQELELEVQEFRSGRMVVSEEGSVVMNDMASEITMLRTENDKLRVRVKAMQQVIETQSDRIAAYMADREAASLSHQDESTGQVVARGVEGMEQPQLSSVIKVYIRQIEELKSRLVLSESLSHQNPGSPFRRAPSSVRIPRPGSSSSAMPFNQETEDLLEYAKSDIQRLREREERKISVSDLIHHSHSHSHSQRRGLHSGSHEAASTPPPPDRAGLLAGGREERPPTVFESDEESNSSNEDDSDGSDDLTPRCSDSSEDSDSDNDDTASLASSIAELSSEINLKQQLVEQLEKAQKSLFTLKQQYEEKMTLLQHQIRSVESERDKVLKEITTRRSSENQERKVREIKQGYEKQLVALKADLKSLKAARKEHARAMKKNAQYELELKRLKDGLLEMKKQRVKMINQMRSEASTKKVEDAQKAREIAKLRKDQRKQQHRIKSLEADAKRREAVLKRRQEELAVLRRTTRLVSAHQRTSATSLNATAGATADPAGGVASGREQRAPTWVQVDTPLQPRERVSRRQSSLFSSDGARKKWRDMERKIMDSIMKRQTIATLAKDMDHWIEKRDQLSRKTEDLRHQREALLKSKTVNMEEVTRVDEDRDSTAAHIEYVQENILELQNDLIAVEDSKIDGDTLEAHSIITSCTPRESKYLLEHLLDKVLNLGARAEQKELEVRSLAARLQASEQSAELLKSFSSPQVGLPPIGTVAMSRQGPNQPPPPPFNLDADSAPVDQDDSNPGRDSPQNQSKLPRPGTLTKWRRRTALPTELAAGRQKPPSDLPSPAGQEMQVEDLESPDGDGAGASGNDLTQLRRGSGGAAEVVRRKGVRKRVTGTNSLEVPPSSLLQCPGSPSMGRGMRSANSEGNVWARLANTPHDSAGDTSKGSLQAESDPRKSNPRLLTCTHTACGHHASVLSVYATQTMLFSASQDRTVKVWDLRSGSELLSLDKHFSYVRKVKYCARSKLIFTASQSLIKIWDLRNYRAKCIKTFGPPSGSGTSSSDTVVQDLLVSASGHSLFSAAGSSVNIWDLRKFMHCGRLVGHNGAVCALTMKGGGLMATGSRDRLIKLYDLDAVNLDDTSGGVSQTPMCTLYPPHYDAVSSLAVYKDLLFSACGVTIKQWDIKEHSLKQAVDRAHPQGNTIHSLGTLSSPLLPLLVSGCKGGILKLWSPENCANIGEVPAHKNSINSIATNDTCIFTGSSDKTIRIWRPSPTQDS